MGQAPYCSAANAGVWRERGYGDGSTLGLLHNPSTSAPSHCTFQGTCVPVQGMYGCGKDCLILIPFRLPQISCFILSLKCFSSDSDSCPDVGIRPLLQFSHLLKAGPVLLTLLFSPPSSFILPSFAWFCIFSPSGQVLLSALGWCSACTSVPEGVFLMCPMERDVLHVHLLLCHLVLLLGIDFLPSSKHLLISWLR